MHDNDSADTALDDAVIAVLEGLPRPVTFVHKIRSEIVDCSAECLAVDDWLAKLCEELAECAKCVDIIHKGDEEEEIIITVLKDQQKLAEELTDVITVCTSWMEALGIDLQERAGIGKLVAEKNAQRGYFK